MPKIELQIVEAALTERRLISNYTQAQNEVTRVYDNFNDTMTFQEKTRTLRAVASLRDIAKKEWKSFISSNQGFFDCYSDRIAQVAR